MWPEFLTTSITLSVGTKKVLVGAAAMDVYKAHKVVLFLLLCLKCLIS